jgi:hypothetical protein
LDSDNDLDYVRSYLARSVETLNAAAHDRPQRSVGLHRGAIDANALALHQTTLGDELQDEGERLLVRFVRKAAACLRQPRMIGNFVALSKPQEISQRP